MSIHDSPPTAFKFLHKDDLHWITQKKTLIISSNSYFREQYHAMEVPDAAINDPREGVTEINQTSDFHYGEATEEEQARARMLPIPIGSNSHFSRNWIIERVPEFHLLSFTCGSLAESKEVFCVENAGLDRPYDACLAIPDVVGLANCIVEEALLVCNDQSDGPPMCGLFPKVYFGFVEYGTKEATWKQPSPPNSPFLKSTEFAQQKEYRLVFEHSKQDGMSKSLPRIIIRVPKLLDFIEEIAL